MKKLKKRLYRIIAGLIVFLLARFLPLDSMFSVSDAMIDNIQLIIYLIAYFIVGGDVVKEATENILHGQVFDENFLMTVATVGAFLVSEYPEAVAVMLFYQVGELFQSYAVNKSRKSIAELMDIRPDYAVVKKNDGNLAKKDPYDVKIDDIIIVKPGEKVALDGIVVNGSASLDVSKLTGESILRDVDVNDEVISGSINKNGLIEIKVTKEFSESTVSKILDLVENASDKKAETENFITKFAKWYTPIVCACALIIAILPPLILNQAFSSWIYRALTFLVISCPCALVISVPLSFFGGLGGASANGVLIKGSNYIEALSKCNSVVFDKTGTLTKGSFNVTEINALNGVNDNELLEYAAFGESYSNHPIALSIKKDYYNKFSTDEKSLTDKTKDVKVTEVAGHGTEINVNGKNICVGNGKLMKKNNITYTEYDGIGTVVYVAVDGKYIGNIIISDEIKENSKEAIAKLGKLGIDKTVMLTGDRNAIGVLVGKELGIKKVCAELLPGDKVDKLESLLEENKGQGVLAYVGDGINDAPVLARADVGIAMGALGSDAAIEAADVVLMDDNPLGIVKAVKIARKTMRLVTENIVFAIGVKILVLVLAALGIANMWAAVFADVGVAVIAILNALRALKMPK
ncbi:MAG: heavy metal translocating P-type ATPase [Eubacteriales bacterium]|nr:heavy metal translocating P-type ATPase [Eubacteriales bacterium]